MSNPLESLTTISCRYCPRVRSLSACPLSPRRPMSQTIPIKKTIGLNTLWRNGHRIWANYKIYWMTYRLASRPTLLNQIQRKAETPSPRSAPITNKPSRKIVVCLFTHNPTAISVSSRWSMTRKVSKAHWAWPPGARSRSRACSLGDGSYVTVGGGVARPVLWFVTF